MSKAVARRTNASNVDAGTVPELQVDDLRNDSESALLARGAAYAREYARIEHQPTILLKNLAAVVVALRILYGDMRGQTHPYRQAVKSLYRDAGVKSDSSDKMQTAVRWHISNILRTALTETQLLELDLKPTSALERQQDDRAKNAALVAGLKAAETASHSTPNTSKKSAGQTAIEEPASAGHPVKATADHLRLAHAAGSILNQLDEDVIKSHMAAGQRAKLDKELAAIQQRISKLRRLTRAKS